MFVLKQKQIVFFFVFLTGSLLPLTFLSIVRNFQVVDVMLILLYLGLARKRVHIFFLMAVVLMMLLSGLNLLLGHYPLQDYFEVITTLIQIAFIVFFLLPTFSALDDHLHKAFFRGFAVSCGILAGLMLLQFFGQLSLPVFESTYTQNRWTIIGMEPNSTSRIFFTGIIALIVMGNGRFIRGALLKIILFLLCFGASALTGSRSFYLAMAILLLLMLYITRKKWGKILVSFLKHNALRILLISGVLFSLLLQPSVYQYFDSIYAKAFDKSRMTIGTSRFDPSTGLTSDSDSQRIFLLQKSVSVFWENLFWGTGLELSAYSFADPRYPVYVPTVHNAFIGFAVEVGIFGVLIMIIIAAGLFKAIRYCPRKELICLLCVFTYDMTSTLQWTRMNWIPIVAFFTWATYLHRQKLIEQQKQLYSYSDGITGSLSPGASYSPSSNFLANSRLEGSRKS